MINYSGSPYGANILVGETDSKTHIKYYDRSWQVIWRKTVKKSKMRKQSDQQCAVLNRRAL